VYKVSRLDHIVTAQLVAINNTKNPCDTVARAVTQAIGGKVQGSGTVPVVNYSCKFEIISENAILF
jgi:hypothetical protein